MLVKRLDKAGNLLNLDETKRIKSGLVVLNPTQEVGSHITENREEVIIILEGSATVEIEGEGSQEVKGGHLVYIPHNVRHNVKNVSNIILRYIYLVSLNN